MVNIIFAHGINQGNAELPFGLRDGLPWGHVEADMLHFRKTTKDAIVLMGKNTWDSLPFLLPSRINAVMSNNGVSYDVNGKMPHHVYDGMTLEDVLEDLIAKYPNKEIFIIGGLGMIYEGLQFADNVYITEIHAHGSFEATHFVDGSKVYPTIMTEFNQSVDIRDYDYGNIDVKGLRFCKYERR